MTHYLGQPPDTVLLNVAELVPERLEEYAHAGAIPVEPGPNAVKGQVRRLIAHHFSGEQRGIRHDARKVLAKCWPDTV